MQLWLFIQRAKAIKNMNMEVDSFREGEIMRSRIFFVAMLAVICSIAFGQSYKIKPSYMTVNGVSNGGMVSGNEEWAGPYLLWNPDTDQVINIGGVAAGDGVGGVARFSADGMYLSGSAYKQIPVSMDWQKEELSEYDYIFTSIAFPGEGPIGYAAGQSSTYMGHGIVLLTYDGGANWFPVWEDDQNRGIESMSFPDEFTGYICGWSEYFAKTTDGGYSWESLDPSGGGEVYLWTSVVFKDVNNGMIGGIVDDDIVVYYTSDGGLTWNLGAGLNGAPAAIAHAGGDTYYLTTGTGLIQKSINNGQSWTNVYSVPMGVLLGLGFWDENTGYVVGESDIYHTSDGGNSWTVQSVGPDGLWHDVYYLDAQNIVIVGTPDIIYESNDGGNTWHWANENLADFEAALYGIAKSGDRLVVCGSGGTFYNRSTVAYENVTEMARYSVADEQWTSLGSFEVNVDGNFSSGWTISGDGNTVAGNAWKEGYYAHAVAWNPSEGFMDLGSLYPSESASTRAEAVSHDGSIIVGYQDFNGPWKSAVWKKNPAGGYFPNEYLLFDPAGSPYDEDNQLAMAMAISANGQWIGGQGDWVTDGEPWIWNESTGCTLLGSIDGQYGTVTGLNNDGSIAVGYFGGGPWAPRVPFIWIRDIGMQNMNDYAVQTLGLDLAGTQMNTPIDISDNGQYIVGLGFAPDQGPWGEEIAFRLQLGSTSTAQDLLPNANLSLGKLYPNPFSAETQIEYKLHEAQTVRLAIYNQRGQLVTNLVSSLKNAGTHTVSWDGRDLKGKKVSKGIYFVRLVSNNQVSQKKMVYLGD